MELFGGCGKGDAGQQGSGGTANAMTFIQRMENVKSFNCSEYTTWALKTDGTLWGCGFNSYGQQGSGNTTNVKTFTQRLTDVKSVSCSDDTTWAIKNDGTLWGCGRGNYGQQSHGNTYGDTLTFTQRMENVKDVACSNFTTWAIKNDSTLWGCGYNYFGQQGDGDVFNYRNAYIFSQRLTNAKQVACSKNTTWAIKEDGSLWGCGYNIYGQQGSGSSGGNVTPFIQRGTNMKSVMVGGVDGDTTWALKNSGALWGCGRNNRGQQGSGNTTDVNTFTQRLTDVKDAVCSWNATWALKTDGTLWGCGRNGNGQQGDNSIIDVLAFTQRTLS